MAETPSSVDTISTFLPDIEKTPSLVDNVIDSQKYRNVPLPAPSQIQDNLTSSRKIAIATFLILCNSVLFLSFGSCMGGGFSIGASFGVHDPTTTAWIAASYPLTQGAFVLISGRIGAVYGHKNILFLGGVWWILWSMINGFCTTSIIPFSIARAMSGIGAAFVMPNIVAILGITFPPGRGRNLVLGFFGFGAPVGGTIGVLLIAVFIEWVQWRWFFFTIAILGGVLFGALWFVLPPENAVDKEGSVDWLGAFIGLTSLILFNFVWNQAPAVGWHTSYEIALLPVSIIGFICFAIWEHRFAKSPIMPLDIWTAPSFLALVLVVLFSIMSYGIALWYMVAWQQLVRQWSVFHFAIGLIPHAIFGGLAAPFAAWLIPRVAAQWIMAFGASFILLSSVLLVTMPAQQSYWAQVFPATILMALCPDFMFTAAQIVATNSVRRHEQGIAGSLISLLQLYGASIGLGFAGTVEANTNRGGMETLVGYRGALYFAIGLAVAALVIDVLFVRVPKDEREGWQHEEDMVMKSG
ncbi:MFS general substrate transporter [Mollisia scopiformis]|uniref:MFS general substrate transporter n=1 Tax=Mollisia scopiformis TaxID=149040 RepID=A0A194X435_MOLSC|nr:MFS general substrate transporter [Mollisia scopiformis]KUJ14948.1 MFS general substrate transporter [Mollisia scopiformis]